MVKKLEKLKTYWEFCAWSCSTLELFLLYAIKSSWDDRIVWHKQYRRAHDSTSASATYNNRLSKNIVILLLEVVLNFYYVWKIYTTICYYMVSLLMWREVNILYSSDKDSGKKNTVNLANHSTIKQNKTFIWKCKER